MRFANSNGRDNKKAFIIYPENKAKNGWDLWMTLVLLTTCVLTPLNIAFSLDKSIPNLKLVDIIIDLLFLADVIIIFNTAFYTEDYECIDDRGDIAMAYVSGWLFVDVLSIIPFDAILQASNFNKLARVARVGRLYKLVKLTKLFRILKIMKEKNKLFKYINEYLKIGAGFERLFFFLMIFILCCHVGTCLWLIIAVVINDYENEYKGTWLNKFYDDYGSSKTSLYYVSLYWTITTITTVGYGDISGTNNFERFFCSLMMVIGVVSFSFANGSLASIIANYDNRNAFYAEKLNILQKAQKEYKIPLDLFIQLKKSIKFESQKDLDDLNRFVEDLPHQLKIKTSVFIYESRYSKLKFFKDQSISFISWCCPILKPQYYESNQFIYYEGDNITEIHFMTNGLSSYVIPIYSNIEYMKINPGEHFGVMDIIGSTQFIGEDLDSWYDFKH